MDGGAWRAAVHGVTKSRTRLSNFTFIHWRRKWQLTLVLLPGKSHGWRSLAGCSPWGRWVGHDWVTSLSLFTFMYWRRNGNPLQCSCLENPRDGGAWWAAVYGVAQSRTRLKWLSSSSSIHCCGSKTQLPPLWKFFCFLYFQNNSNLFRHCFLRI